MLVINNYTTELEFNLSNGVYTFSNESATGKTWLSKLMDEYRAFGEPVASYTYNDKLKGIPIQTVLNPLKFKVVLLDRYDLYLGDGYDIINTCCKDCVILVDCKSNYKVNPIEGLCEINIEPNKIKVVSYDFYF